MASHHVACILFWFVDHLSLRKHSASVKLWLSLSPHFMNVALCKSEEERGTCCAPLVQRGRGETEFPATMLQWEGKN